ncbi:MAG: hypothetical protein IKC47_03755 [Clostridia bacterium]|nr:hypothetical protein [Clostridia bacterium]
MSFFKTVDDYVETYQNMSWDELRRSAVLVTKAIVRNLQYYFGVYEMGARKFICPIFAGFCLAGVDRHDTVIADREFQLFQLVMAEVFNKHYTRSDFDKYVTEASSTKYLDKVKRYAVRNSDIRDNIAELGVIVGFYDYTLTKDELAVVNYIKDMPNSW